MGIVGKIELVSDVISLASGQLPMSSGFRLVSMFFRGKKRRLTKARLKKLMMMRRRMFVDNVIMHHKRLHDKNREQIIEETKTKIAGRKEKAKSGEPSKQPKIGQSRSSSRREQDIRPAAKQLKSIIMEQNKTHERGFVYGKQQEKGRDKWVDRIKGNMSSIKALS